MNDAYETLDYDRELYHRALTGRGQPITNEEVLALLDAIDEYITDYRSLETEKSKLEQKLDDAWMVPQEEPHRPCTICTSSNGDRGDGRCMSHGRIIQPQAIVIDLTMRDRRGRGAYAVRLNRPDVEAEVA